MAVNKIIKYKKVKNVDTNLIELAYVAGISSLGMAYKLTLANIDIIDALVVEKEAIKLSEINYKYFNMLTPLMINKISISAIKISRNLEKYNSGMKIFRLQ